MRFVHVILVSLLIAGAAYWVYLDIKKIRDEAVVNASNNLMLTRDTRIAQLRNYVKTIYSEVRFWSQSKSLQGDMLKIFKAWDELGAIPNMRARQLYITDNPLYPNYTVDYYNANDGSDYSEIHEKFHRLLRGLTKQRGYIDVFLIAVNGDVIYSVFKDDEYATNLNTGKYKETDLAIGFREVMDNTNLNHVSLYDYNSYQPNNNNPASFIQTSVVNEKNKTIGVLAFQLPVEPINHVLNNRSGLDDGIKVLAVGSDRIQRNRVGNIDTVLHSIPIEKALAGEDGVEKVVDHNGISTISAYAPFEFSQNILGSTKKNRWAIVVKQNLTDVLRPANDEIKMKLMLLAILTFVSMLLAWLISYRKVDLRITEE